MWSTKPVKPSKNKNPYWVISVYLHAAAIYFVATNLEHLTPNTVSAAEHVEALHYTHDSYKKAMQSRIDDMEHIKKNLDALAHNNNQITEFEKGAAENKTIEQLYTESEELLADIRTIENTYLQEKLKQLPQEEQRSAEPGNETPETNETTKKKEQNNISEKQAHKPTAEEMVQKTAINQRQARTIFDKIQMSEQAKQEGHNIQSQSKDNSGGSAPYDTNNPLAVEQHFNNLSRGNRQDLVSEMQRYYHATPFLSPELDADKGESPSKRKQLKVPPNNRQDRRFLFSRKLDSNGEKTQWLILDSWYFIGPYPNKDRANLHTRFAPETGVDLDAMYIGDNNRLIKWQHIEYDHLPIIPPEFTDFAIYYAYTEVLSDSEQNVWLNIGSDDQSKLWINDILVWQSSNAQKVWMVSEGRRRITLKKGRNQFLFRLENGVQRAAFSIVVSEG